MLVNYGYFSITSHIGQHTQDKKHTQMKERNISSKKMIKDDKPVIIS